MSKQEKQSAVSCCFQGCDFKIKMCVGVGGAYQHILQHYQRTNYKIADEVCRNLSQEHICKETTTLCVRRAAARLMPSKQDGQN